ncbi:MAG: hypothetical protein QXX95_06540 [Nitrososphaerales archaeon]
MKKLESLSWKELVKNREASFYSIRNIFLHKIHVLHRIIENVIREKEIFKIDFDSFKNFQEIRDYIEQVNKILDGYLSSLNEEELKRIVKIQTS